MENYNYQILNSKNFNIYFCIYNLNKDVSER